ncbi:MFS transporter [Streptomyces sp. NRRL S-1824]|uniref:MFS transporter n=1 Tax=Streptomyces sp. NRRL S-1824 TaxID=1463889 RepID=UPI0004C5ABE9|nr:MFS transporter [Streptomyces sp. NRRL S-1824]
MVDYSQPPGGVSGAMLGRWLLNGVTAGLYVAGSAVFFLRYVGLSPRTVGVGLSIAFGLNLVTKVPFGRAADRWGSTPVWLVGAFGSAITYALYPLMHSFPAFLAVVVAGNLAGSLDGIASSRYLAEVMPGAARTASRSYLRSVANLGMAVGTGVAGAVFASGTRSSYLALIYACAALSLTEGLLVVLAVRGGRGQVPVVAPMVRTGSVWRDHPYLLVAALSGACRLSGPMLSIAVPIWIVSATDAPTWTISATLLANMAIVIVAQVAVSHGADTVAGAARVQRLAAGTLALACVLFQITQGTGGMVTILMLFAAVLALTMSEMYASAAGNSLSYALAQVGQEGEYLAAFALGTQVTWAVGPVLLTGVAIAWTPIGWVLVAGGLLALAAASRPLVGLAERRLREAIASGTTSTGALPT